MFLIKFILEFLHLRQLPLIYISYRNRHKKWKLKKIDEKTDFLSDQQSKLLTYYVNFKYEIILTFFRGIITKWQWILYALFYICNASV